jgi:hypothetical protein
VTDGGPFGGLTPAEAGRRSGEMKRRQAPRTPEEKALDAIGQKLGRLTSALLDAALGEGDFEALDPKIRVTAVLRALEWRLGKPTVAKQQSPEEEPIPIPADLFGSPVEEAPYEADPSPGSPDTRDDEHADGGPR